MLALLEAWGEKSRERERRPALKASKEERLKVAREGASKVDLFMKKKQDASKKADCSLDMGPNVQFERAEVSCERV